MTREEIIEIARKRLPDMISVANDRIVVLVLDDSKTIAEPNINTLLLQEGIEGYSPCYSFYVYFKKSKLGWQFDYIENR